MKSFLIFILLLSVCSCQIKDDLNGVWIGPYRGSEFVNEAVVSSPVIMSFKDGKYIARGLYIKDDSGNYNYSSRDFTLNNKVPMIFASKPNMDSISFIGTTDDPFPHIFRKVPDSLKSNSFSKVKLSSRKFIIRGIKDTDTLFFGNDSTVSRSSKKSDIYYKRLNFQDFDILFVADGRTPPLFIRGMDEGEVKMTSYDNKLKDLILTEI